MGAPEPRLRNQVPTFSVFPQSGLLSMVWDVAQIPHVLKKVS